jgi:hypothetical protein
VLLTGVHFLQCSEYWVIYINVYVVVIIIIKIGSNQ